MALDTAKVFFQVVIALILLKLLAIWTANTRAGSALAWISGAGHAE